MDAIFLFWMFVPQTWVIIVIITILLELTDGSNGRQIICHRMPDREGHWNTASKLFEPVGRRRQA